MNLTLSLAFLLAGVQSVAKVTAEDASYLFEQQSACNSVTNEKQCYATTDEDGNGCQWCKCQAVPPVCVTQEQANDLPAGVFDCSAPGYFPFLEYRSYNLKENEMGNSDLCDASSKSISGYMDIKGSKYDQSGEEKHLFFWMFEKRNAQNSTSTSDEIPFVVWLTGGPGCSSTMALLTENGPCSVKADGETTTPNPYSWTEAAHVLWLDQPAGVGFSYGEETDNSEDMVAEDAYFFLQVRI